MNVLFYKLYRFITQHLFKVNWVKTIYFNFRKLPFKDAIKLPFFIYGKMEFRSLSGKINILGNAIPGMIKIGGGDYVCTSVSKSVWQIDGVVNFSGRVKFLQGTYMFVSKSAEINFGSGNLIGTNTHIMCYDRISLGNNVRITWDCNVYDTNFHYIENLTDHSVLDMTDPIEIGDNVWIGNKTTIGKGAKLVNNTIVAANSLVNKDFSYIEEYSLLAGCPAKLKACGLKRIYDSYLESCYDKKFGHVRSFM